MNVSNVMPERVVFGWSRITLIGAVPNVESVGNVAVPPLLGTTPFTQFAGLLQLPPAVPTSAAHVPLVWAKAADDCSAAAAADARTSERRTRLGATGVLLRFT